MKYEYMFKRIDLKSGFFKTKPSEDYRDAIKSNAREGWRFVQIFAPATSGYGSASYFEMIFERPLD